MPQTYLTSLTPRIFWSPPDSERDRPVMGALVGQNATLIVETGASPAHARQFLSALAELGVAPPRFAALTHWHWDHVFGTAAMNLPTIAHVETRLHILEMARLDWRDHALDHRVSAGQELAFIAQYVKIELSNAERSMLVIVPPEITFTDQVEVDLGGLTARIIHVGGDHTSDSSVIFALEERVVFLGDCLYNGFIGKETFYTLRRLFPLLDMLENLPADFYLLAHEPTPLTRAQFLHEINQMRCIGELVGKKLDRKSILARLPALLGEPVNENHVDTVDSLLRGLKEPSR